MKEADYKYNEDQVTVQILYNGDLSSWRFHKCTIICKI